MSQMGVVYLLVIAILVLTVRYSVALAGEADWIVEQSLGGPFTSAGILYGSFDSYVRV